MKRPLIGFLAFTLTFIGLIPVGAQATLPATPPVLAGSLRIGLANPWTVNQINSGYGPIHYGADYGLNLSGSDYTAFNSSTLAVQALAAGQVDVISASFISFLASKEAGLDLKVFCSAQRVSDSVLVGRNGIKELEQLFDPNTRAALDQPTSPINALINAVLQKKHITKTVADIPNIKILNTGVLKLAALQNNDVDVAALTIASYNQSVKTIPDLSVLARPYSELPTFIYQGFAATSDWLNAHQDQATAFCASVLKGAHMLTADFASFSKAVHEFVSAPPDEASLKEYFGLLTTYDFWALRGTFSADDTNFMINLATSTGLLKSAMKADDILDLRPYQAALKMLPPEYQATQGAATASAMGTGTPAAQ